MDTRGLSNLHPDESTTTRAYLLPKDCFCSIGEIG
jgi:hypothetical protein